LKNTAESAERFKNTRKSKNSNKMTKAEDGRSIGIQGRVREVLARGAPNFVREYAIEKEWQESLARLKEKLPELRRVKNRLPRTVLIIPDGGRRFAKEHGISDERAYNLGARLLYEGLMQFDEFSEVKNIILWAWSTDNEIKRPREQKEAVFKTMAKCLADYRDELVERNARVTRVGRIDRLTLPLARELGRAELATGENSGTNIILAIDYGEDYEDSLFAQEVARSNLNEWAITPELAVRLREQARSIPVPDLVIRTSGELHLSKFPYSNHAELVVVDTNLPATMPDVFADALLSYTNRDIRGGR